ncbi:unnamed protein product [Meloidogyne enterolobii]|uniref:Uncharacterized protein n=1 Tax=Meloidogyne enterolobii TaxID=390850 RepID=A0ACB0Y9D6_MELEN
MEKRIIKWLEVIPKPTKIETVEGAIINIIEETKVNETNESDKNEKEEDKLEEDPNKRFRDFCAGRLLRRHYH